MAHQPARLIADSVVAQKAQCDFLRGLINDLVGDHPSRHEQIRENFWWEFNEKLDTSTNADHLRWLVTAVRDRNRCYAGVCTSISAPKFCGDPWWCTVCRKDYRAARVLGPYCCRVCKAPHRALACGCGICDTPGCTVTRSTNVWCPQNQTVQEGGFGDE